MTEGKIAASLYEPLNGSRVRLRPPQLADTGPLALYAGDRRVASMTTSIPHPYPPGAAEAWVSATLTGKSPEIAWAIDASPDGGAELVGVISIKRATGELGYWVGPPYWGTGYASEAAGLVCRHLLSNRIDRIGASVFFDNSRSERVLRRTGFRQTGDTWLYSVARGDEVPALTFELTAADVGAIG